MFAGEPQVDIGVADDEHAIARHVADTRGDGAS